MTAEKIDYITGRELMDIYKSMAPYNLDIYGFDIFAERINRLLEEKFETCIECNCSYFSGECP